MQRRAGGVGGDENWSGELKIWGNGWW